EGATIYIPGVERDRGGRMRRQLSGLQRRALALAGRLGLCTRHAARALVHRRVEARWARAAERSQRMPGHQRWPVSYGLVEGRVEARWPRAAERSQGMPGHLRWPVSNGWSVRGFGSGEGGYLLAVDIMGRIGWNVRAAAPGIVAYAGDEVPGFGNIVLLV